MKFSLIPPIWKFIGAGVIAAALMLIITLSFRSCDKRHDNEINNAVNAGATTERAQSQSETINAVQEAKNVVEHPTANQLNVVCSKYDRKCPHGS